MVKGARHIVRHIVGYRGATRISLVAVVVSTLTLSNVNI